MPLQSIETNIKPDKLASAVCLETCYFKKEAFFKENYFYDGIYYDSIIYSKLNK